MKRGLILRQVTVYKLPHALRMSVGTEEANQTGGKGSGRVLGKSGVSEAPIFNRLALIGFGLIGGSIARAARAQGAVRSIVATARSPQTRKRVAELGVVDQVIESNGRRGRRRRSGDRLHPRWRLRRGRQGNRPRI
jgi:hypothetical protein